MYSLNNYRRLLSLTCQSKSCEDHLLVYAPAQLEGHGISYVKASGGTINLVNTVAQSNHITAGGFGSRTAWVLSKFCRYILSSNLLCSSKRSTVSSSRCASTCIP